LTIDIKNDIIDFDKEDLAQNKRESIFIPEKTACRMASGFLTTDVCGDVSADFGTCLL
jgi:hypothetical protein